MKKKFISICIPVFNEEKNIVLLIKKIESFFLKNLNNFNYEIIFSDNKSTDDTIKTILKIRSKNKKIKLISNKKNIGYDLSVYKNLTNSKGDAAIVIDCDMQDPVNLIKVFIDKWLNGFDIVYGVRKRRLEPFFFHFWRKLFYLVAYKFSKKKYPLYASDFRLLDRSIIKKIKNYKDVIYTRNLPFQFSKNSYGVKYNRNFRKRGKSKFGFISATLYALKYFISQTFLFHTLFFISYLINLIFLTFSFEFFFDKLLLFTFLLNIIFLLYSKKIKSDQDKLLN